MWSPLLYHLQHRLRFPTILDTDITIADGQWHARRHKGWTITIDKQIMSLLLFTLILPSTVNCYFGHFQTVELKIILGDFV